MSSRNEFTCAACDGTFEKAWTDEEANAEADELWGEDLGDEPATVCEDCFQAIWYKVPYGLRLAVWAAYQPGQERLDGTAFPTDEYLEVAREAIDAVAAKEGRRAAGGGQR